MHHDGPMASTRNTIPMHDRLRTHRQRLGLSLVEARDRLVMVMPARYLPSVATLSRMETGKIDERKVDGIVIHALAEVYGCKVRDLSPMVAAESERIRDLLVRASPWNTAPMAGAGIAG
jgi:transcriptional regulator with XRE-family HTH domain